MNNFTKLCDEYSYSEINSDSEGENFKVVEREETHDDDDESLSEASNDNESKTDPPNHVTASSSNHSSPSETQHDESQENIDAEVDGVDVDRSKRNCQPGVYVYFQCISFMKLFYERVMIKA
ncbi:hypothetical protein KQX54_013429 [Cotesia glomerata]|uniref:Uncharacterized protein n=1 Tax=Cotesia glomerata TaxID=32391 RepID=A0AAV7HR94_COTGL|nr:hypothetical protein KQX54_013429 [Cotesia glomerata]